jgi:hypothetical protein
VPDPTEVVRTAVLVLERMTDIKGSLCMTGYRTKGQFPFSILTVAVAVAVVVAESDPQREPLPDDSRVLFDVVLALCECFDE